MVWRAHARAARNPGTDFTIKLPGMTRIAERTVLFADLRGSTALFETLGNAEATSVVTHTVATPSASRACLRRHPGQDPRRRLMAVFASPAEGRAGGPADARGTRGPGQPRARARRIAGPAWPAPAGGLARGEVVEMGGDCFGDAVNVAARLIDHAGDNETLITAEVLTGLPADAAAALPQPRLDAPARPRRAGAGACAGRAPRWRPPPTQFGDVTITLEPEACA
jgi:adenylate cyclase